MLIFLPFGDKFLSHLRNLKEEEWKCSFGIVHYWIKIIGMHIYHLDVFISILHSFIGDFSSSYSIFLDLIKYLTQPLDHAKLNCQVYPCECVCVCVCVYVCSISLWAYKLIFLHALKLYQRKTVRSNRSTSDAVLQSLLAYRQNILLKLTLKRR